MNDRDDINEQRRLGGVMQALAWLVFLGIAVFFFGERLERQYNPNQSVQTQYSPGGQLEVVLERNRSGHYVTTGQINDLTVTFLLDTGATGVAVPPGIARQLGLKRGAPVTTRTANGTVTSYAVMLDRVSVGGIELRGVPALISPGLSMEEVLLGMSFLQHIEFTQRGNTLILRQ